MCGWGAANGAGRAASGAGNGASAAQRSRAEPAGRSVRGRGGGRARGSGGGGRTWVRPRNNAGGRGPCAAGCRATVACGEGCAVPCPPGAGSWLLCSHPGAVVGGPAACVPSRPPARLQRLRIEPTIKGGELQPRCAGVTHAAPPRHSPAGSPGAVPQSPARAADTEHPGRAHPAALRGWDAAWPLSGLRGASPPPSGAGRSDRCHKGPEGGSAVLQAVRSRHP